MRKNLKIKFWIITTLTLLVLSISNGTAMADRNQKLQSSNVNQVSRTVKSIQEQFNRSKKYVYKHNLKRNKKKSYHIKHLSYYQKLINFLRSFQATNGKLTLKRRNKSIHFLSAHCRTFKNEHFRIIGNKRINRRSYEYLLQHNNKHHHSIYACLKVSKPFSNHNKSKLYSYHMNYKFKNFKR